MPPEAAIGSPPPLWPLCMLILSICGEARNEKVIKKTKGRMKYSAAVFCGKPARLRQLARAQHGPFTSGPQVVHKWFTSGPQVVHPCVKDACEGCCSSVRTGERKAQMSSLE